MTVRSQVLVVCDDFLPRVCMGRVELVTADLKQAEALARQKAHDAGWQTERTADGRVLSLS
jgi:hypothetical protein